MLTIVMSDNKTVPTDAGVEDFLDNVEHPTRRKDGYRLLEIMSEITNEKPVMWGSSIIGFGLVHYKYESGREGDMPIVGFSPRKSSLSVYIMPSLDNHKPLLEKLGKHRTGVSCLYINRLDDVDESVLREIITDCVKWQKEHWS